MRHEGCADVVVALQGLPMTIKTTDRWKVKRQRATPADVFAFFETNPPARLEDSKRVINRVYTLCEAAGIDFSLAVSRIADETGATNGPSFLVSDIYRERLNLGGLGVTDGEDEMLSFATPEQAADAYMAHLFTYIFGRFDILGVDESHDPRFDDTPVSWRGSVSTLQDLQGRWFSNPKGAINSAERGNRIFPGIADQQQEDPPPVPTLKPWKLARYVRIMQPGPIYANGKTGRPDAKLRLDAGTRGGLILVVHETDNYSSTARSEADWAVNTGNVSPHLYVDQFGYAQIVPLDSIGYHAGDGCNNPATDDGCFRGVAIETIVNANQNWDVIRWNLAEVIARVALGDPMFDWGSGSTRGKFSINRIYQHIQVSAPGPDQHHCPDNILKEGFWPELMRRVDVKYAEVQEETTSTTTTPAPNPYPKVKIPAPDVIEAQGHPLTINKTRRYGAIQGGMFKTGPSLNAPDASKTPYKAGRQYTFDYSTIVGNVEWLVSKAGSWAPMKNFKV